MQDMLRIKLYLGHICTSGSVHQDEVASLVKQHNTIFPVCLEQPSRLVWIVRIVPDLPSLRVQQSNAAGIPGYDPQFAGTAEHTGIRTVLPLRLPLNTGNRLRA